MSITIRLATKKDMPDVLKLIKELAYFEKEPNAVDVTVDELQKDGFAGYPEFICFVAEINNNIEGMALAYKRYSTWKGVILHLEDLIVKKESRGLGIGTKLLDRIVLYGNKIGVKRISWEVLDWNKSAIDFYNKKGAHIKKDWRVVHLDQKGIKEYISKL